MSLVIENGWIQSVKPFILLLILNWFVLWQIAITLMLPDRSWFTKRSSLLRGHHILICQVFVMLIHAWEVVIWRIFIHQVYTLSIVFHPDLFVLIWVLLWILSINNIKVIVLCVVFSAFVADRSILALWRLKLKLWSEILLVTK